MIKCDKETTQISGTGKEIIVDFVIIVKGIIDGGCPKRLLDKAYELAFKSDEEIKAEEEKLKSEFLNEIAPKIINELSDMIKKCQEDSKSEDKEDND